VSKRRGGALTKRGPGLERAFTSHFVIDDPFRIGLAERDAGAVDSKNRA
jgi:hypothetical protein